MTQGPERYLALHSNEKKSVTEKPERPKWYRRKAITTSCAIISGIAIVFTPNLWNRDKENLSSTHEKASINVGTFPPALKTLNPKPISTEFPTIAGTFPQTADICSTNQLPGPLANYPDEKTTGVPPGITLTAVKGDYHTKADGEVVDRRNISGVLYVDNNNVTVKCSRVRVQVRNNATNLHIWSTTIGDVNGVRGGSGLTAKNYTARRLNVFGTIDGLKAEGNVDVRDSYIHDMFHTTDSSQQSGVTHNDGIQIGLGANMVIQHNTIYAWSFSAGQTAGANLLKTPYGDGAGYMTSAIIIKDNRGPTRKILIEDNLIRGRASKYIVSNGSPGSVRLINNRFGREDRDFPQLYSNNNSVIAGKNVFFDTLTLVK